MISSPASRRSARGVTLVEMLIVSLLTAMVIGGAISVLGVVSDRGAEAAALASAQMEADRVADTIETTVREAFLCELLTADTNPGLRCTMPFRGEDTDNDGHFDRFDPLLTLGRRGTRVFHPTSTATTSNPYSNAGRIWYYMAQQDGNVDTPGQSSGEMIWRAYCANTNFPGPADADAAWSTVAGGASRFPLVTNVTFHNVNPTYRTVTFTVRASALAHRDRVNTGADSEGETVKVTRTVTWRNNPR